MTFEGQNEGNRPLFFLLHKYLKVSRAYESLNSGLCLTATLVKDHLVHASETDITGYAPKRGYFY
jgi:hypothetical protein